MMMVMLTSNLLLLPFLSDPNFLPHLSNDTIGVCGSSHSSSRDNQIGPCICNSINRGRTNPSVHLNVQAWKLIPQPPYFIHHVRHELLPPKPWFNRHDQDQVDLCYVTCNDLNICPRFDRDSHLHSRLFYVPDTFSRVIGGFHVERVWIGTCVWHGRNPFEWMLNHHMHIKVRFWSKWLSKARNNRMAKCEVGYKWSVHDI